MNSTNGSHWMSNVLLAKRAGKKRSFNHLRGLPLATPSLSWRHISNARQVFDSNLIFQSWFVRSSYRHQKWRRMQWWTLAVLSVREQRRAHPNKLSILWLASRSGRLSCELISGHSVVSYLRTRRGLRTLIYLHLSQHIISISDRSHLAWQYRQDHAQLASNRHSRTLLYFPWAKLGQIDMLTAE